MYYNDDLSAPMFYAPPHNAFQLSTQEWAVTSENSSSVHKLDYIGITVLRLCIGVKTLEQHSMYAYACGLETDGCLLRNALRKLVSDRLLLVYEPHPPELRDVKTNRSVRKHGIYGIITADRPASLTRCLRSLIGHCYTHAAAPTIVIVDGSSTALIQKKNQDIINTLQQETSATLVYVGHEIRQDITDFLVREGFDKDIVHFGTSGGTGANRNVLSLLTMGGVLLTLDDDVICHPWKPTMCGSPIRVMGHDHPEFITPCSSYADCLEGLSPAGEYLLDTHNKVLTWPIPELASLWSGLDMSGACAHAARSFASDNVTIYMSFTGLAGDSGSSCPYRTLLGAPLLRRQAGWDSEVLQRALTSRLVKKWVPQVTLTHSSYCMTYCTGFANQHLLPPFMPRGRNQDGVMGHIMTFCYPQGLSAHLPLGIIHDSGRPNDYVAAEIPDVKLRLCDILIGLITQNLASSISVQQEERLKTLGNAYCAMGRASPVDFSEFLARTTIGRVANVSARAILGDECDVEAIENVARNYRTKIIDSFNGPDAYHQHDFGTGATELATFDLRQYLDNFGTLLGCWSDIRSCMSRFTLDSTHH